MQKILNLKQGTLKAMSFGRLVLTTAFFLLCSTVMMAQQKFHTIQSGETLESIAQSSLSPTSVTFHRPSLPLTA